MHFRKLLDASAASLLLLAGASLATASDHGLVAPRVTAAPVVDGRADDAQWQNAPPVFTQDPVADIRIELRAVHDGTHLYILARYPDPTENRRQKTLVWDEDTGTYHTGPDREDTLVLKWNMEPFPVDLTVTSDDEYLADIWFWKAHRTDPVGYADDKYQRYTRTATQRANQMISKQGQAFYLTRDGDAGDSAYEVITYSERVGDSAPKYRHRSPTGSRADIGAKGSWRDGAWSVEFQRRLETGNADDLQMAPGGRYEFGVSRHEVAGRKVDPTVGDPMYGAGEIGPLIELQIE